MEPFIRQASGKGSVRNGKREAVDEIVFKANTWKKTPGEKQNG